MFSLLDSILVWFMSKQIHFAWVFPYVPRNLFHAVTLQKHFMYAKLKSIFAYYMWLNMTVATRALYNFFFFFCRTVCLKNFHLWVFRSRKNERMFWESGFPFLFRSTFLKSFITFSQRRFKKAANQITIFRKITQ